MSSYLADTTVIIDHLRGNEKATAFLESNLPHISPVTIAELIQGSKDKRAQEKALKTCRGLPQKAISRDISEQAIALMSTFCLSSGLQFLDALIAATALKNNAILVTNNIKHFTFIPGLEVLSHSEAFQESKN